MKRSSIQFGNPGRLALAILFSAACVFLIPRAATAQSGDAANDVLQRESIRRQELLVAAMQKLDEAHKLIAAGKMEEARAKVAEVTSTLPNSGEGAPVHKKASMILSELDTDKAVQAFKKKDYFTARENAALALKENPGNTEAARIVAQTGELLGIEPGKDKPANPAVDKKFIANLNNVQEFMQRGKDLTATGQYDAAEKAFDQALAIDPYNKAVAREKQKLQDKMNLAMEVAHKSSNQERKTAVRDQWTERFQIDKSLGSVQTPNPLPITRKNEFRLDQKLRSLVIKQVNFDNATIDDAVRFLTEQTRQVDPEGTGINFLIRNDQVKQEGKTFNLKLSNVPVGEVLRYVTSLAGLRYRIEDFAVFIVPLSDRNDALVTRDFAVRATFFEVEAAPSEDSSASSPRRRAASTTVESSDSGGSGDDTKKALESRGVQFPEGATAIYSSATGILTVRNTQDQIDLIEELVTENQGESLLVSVQTKVIEVNQNDLDSLDFNFNLAGGYQYPANGTGSHIAGGAVMAGTGLLGAKGLKQSDGLNQYVNGTSASTPRSDTSPTPSRFGMSGSLDGNHFIALLEALSQKTSADVMTAPSILVNDGAQGKVTVAREFYYPTAFDAPKVQARSRASGANANTVTPEAANVIPAWPTTFESRNVGAVITVQPKVTPDRQRVYLVIKPDITEFDGFINYGAQMFSSVDGSGDTTFTTGVLINPNVINQPVFSTRTVENAQMEIQDGYTMVLGGLIREDISTVDDKVPILGDIPLVGRLFRSKAEQAIKKNMLIFVTVRILRPDGEPLNPTVGGMKNPAGT